MISIHPIIGMGEVTPRANLPDLLVAALRDCAGEPIEGDVICITQKIVSKAEGRFRSLTDVSPSPRAVAIAAKSGKDPRLVELILAESVEVLRVAPNVIIARHRLGHVMANAGIDRSNIGPGDEDRVLLLPQDPDASAEAIRAGVAALSGVAVGVVISDSFGRAWRNGVVGVAIGAAGIASMVDQRGRPDRDGRLLEVTQLARADALAAAAGLVTGEADEGVPAVLVRGLNADAGPRNPAAALIRPLAEDLFR